MDKVRGLGDGTVIINTVQ